MTVATETDEPGADATARSARLRHLIFTVYGLYARHDGGWLSVATLIRLLASHNIDAQHFVTHHFGFDDVMQAYDVFSRAGETGALKVVLNRTGDPR